MRLFNNTTLTPPTSKSLRDKPTDGEYVEESEVTKQRGPRRLIKRQGPTNQPHVTENEIREKLLESTNILNKEKRMRDKLASTKESSTFMAEKPVGDVGVNDPNNPVTVGKLKDLMSTGGFSFNDKERKVLAEILGKS